jgi:hypothetical protein
MGDARYTPLTVESMLPFWYFVGSVILDGLDELPESVFDRKVVQFASLNLQSIICAAAL